MTKLTRKLFISLLTVAFAVVTLGTTTFAWFTLSSTAKIETFDAKIAAGAGIEISIDGATFKNTLSLNDILNQIGNVSGYADFKLSAFEFDAVTSSNGYEMKKFDPDSAGNYIDVDGNTSYIQFPLWFRSPTEAAKVKLLSTTKISSPAKSWKSDTTFDYTGYGLKTTVSANDSIDIYAANALRFSFEEYDIHTFPTEGFPKATPKETGITASVFELEPYDQGTTPKKTPNIKLGTGTTSLSVDRENPESLICAPGLLDYFYQKLGRDLIDEYEKHVDGDTTTYGPVLPSLTELGADIATLDKAYGAYFYKHVMVRIWLEGWDPDCFDALLKGSVRVEFAFGV